MRRRRLLKLAGEATAASLLVFSPVHAQQPPLPVIGFLGGTGPAPELVTPFLEGLAEAGFRSGRNVTIEYRWADNQSDRLPALVAELLRHKVQVIVTSGGAIPVRVAKTATTSIPIVFLSVSTRRRPASSPA